MIISVIVAAWGRDDLYKNHLAAISMDSVGIDVEYIVGTIESDAYGKASAIKSHCDSIKEARCVPVVTDRAWPLPVVYNAALLSATADVVLVVGSEVVIPPGLLADASRVPEGTARQYTTNDSSGAQYIGPSRRLAFPYCMAVHRKHMIDVGGWDIAFAGGIGFDDNDLAARLIISGVRFEWCDEYRCKHQAHGKYHGERQTEFGLINQAIWRSRLNGYSDSLWPVAQGPEGDCSSQDRLAAGLSALGYRQNYGHQDRKQES